MALAQSLEHLGGTFSNPKALLLASTLDDATEKLLANRKSPSRKVNELDNRGSHFYLAMYWAEALAAQDKDADLKESFSKLAKTLSDNEAKIVEELNAVQGVAMDIGGYYFPDEDKCEKAMRPSATLNAAMDSMLVKA